MPVILKDPLPCFGAVGSALAVLKSDILRDLLYCSRAGGIPFPVLAAQDTKIWCRISCWAAETPVPYKNGGVARLCEIVKLGWRGRGSRVGGEKGGAGRAAGAFGHS
jgi:hypothetical protein